MRKSNRANCLVLISKHNSSNPYDDKWNGDHFEYTGMGMNGDQSVDYMQNKTVAESNTNGVTLYLFESFESNNYIYRGIVKLDGEPYYEIQEDETVVGVAVHHDGRSLGVRGIGGGDVGRVYLVAVVAGDGGVFQHSGGLQAVIPGRAAGKQRVGFMTGTFDIIDAVRFGKQGVVAHISSCQAAGQGKDDYGRNNQTG